MWLAKTYTDEVLQVTGRQHFLCPLSFVLCVAFPVHFKNEYPTTPSCRHL